MVCTSLLAPCACQTSGAGGGFSNREPEVLDAPDADAYDTPQIEWGIQCDTAFMSGGIGPRAPEPQGRRPSSCGTIRVPLDYRRPEGDRTSVDFWIFSNETGQDKKLVAYNRGGPGGASLSDLPDLSRGWPSSAFETLDLVVFDPRGLGEAEGRDCGYVSPRLSNIDPLAESSADYRGEVERLAERVRARLGTYACQDEVFLHMGTSNTARDLDVLRRALGHERISFFGRSYGAFLGAVYATSFDEHVDTLVLDSPPPPTSDMRDWVRELARGEQRTLEQVISACAEPGCGLGGTVEESVSALRALITELEAHPMPIEAVDGEEVLAASELRGLDVVRLLSHLPYREEASRESRLQTVARLASADPETVRQAVVETALAARGAPMGPARIDFLATFCVDQFPRIDVDDVLALSQELADEGNLFQALPVFMLGGCLAFDGEGVDASSLTISGAGMVRPPLVAFSTEDGVTPARHGEALAALYPGAPTVEVQQSAHGTTFFQTSHCADEVALQHLLGAEVQGATWCVREPDLGETCALLGDPRCRPGLGCDDTPDGDAPRCVPAGSAELDASCEQEHCAPGLHCTSFGSASFEDRCRALCRDSSDCGTGERCVVAADGVSDICVRTCDPFSSPDTCPVNTRCAAPSETSEGDASGLCVRQGAGAVGVPCTSSPECSDGLTCHAGACSPICDAEHPCITGSCDAIGTGPLGACSSP